MLHLGCWVFEAAEFVYALEVFCNYVVDGGTVPQELHLGFSPCIRLVRAAIIRYNVLRLGPIKCSKL